MTVGQLSVRSAANRAKLKLSMSGSSSGPLAVVCPIGLARPSFVHRSGSGRGLVCVGSDELSRVHPKVPDKP